MFIFLESQGATASNSTCCVPVLLLQPTIVLYYQFFWDQRELQSRFEFDEFSIDPASDPGIFLYLRSLRIWSGYTFFKTRG